MHPIQYLVNTIMLPTLAFFFQFTGNYGWSIICLTITIKLLLFPLTVKQTQSMAGLRIIQPKMKQIQEEFKDNPQMLQMKMMELYKEHKVNPLGGCLPTLIQLPFFIAIFVSLNSKHFHALMAASGTQASFFWIADLAKPDKLMILPVLVGLTTYYSQKTMSPGMSKDDPQMRIFAYMPFMMFFIAMNMSSGVLLYWALSSLVTGLQQQLIMLPSKLKAAKKDGVIEIQKIEDPKSNDKQSSGKKPSKKAGAKKGAI